MNPFKKVILGVVGIIMLSISLITFAQSPYPDNVVFYNLAPGVTNMAANSTNTTLGFNYSLANVFKGMAIYVSATTYTNAGTINIYFTTSPDGTLYETPLNSAVKISIPLTNSSSATVATTNTFSDWFQMAGRSRIREARVENLSGTSISNLNIVIGYPYDVNSQNR